MHRRNLGTPGRSNSNGSDFSNNSSGFLPSHYHTPTRPSQAKSHASNDASYGSPMIACSNFSLASHNAKRQSKWLLMTILCVALLVLGRALTNMNSYNGLQKDLAEAQAFHSRNNQALKYARSTSLDLGQKAAILEKENIAMQRKLDEQIKLKEEEIKNTSQLKRRDAAIRKQIDYLQNQIQEVSRREALERFGEGPHLVEFSVIFSDTSEGTMPSKFTVEMAPLELMPHAVLMFLEMVETRLWDETAFVHHTDHIISATPTVYHSGISKREEFQKAGLLHTAFQEYNEEFPHKPYTLGFSGRPGGPDFYISTLDNSQMHGPGGQLNADLIEEADPCFAKVIQGFDVVDKIHQKDMEAQLDVHVVGIVSARIVER